MGSAKKRDCTLPIMKVACVVRFSAGKPFMSPSVMIATNQLLVSKSEASKSEADGM